MYVRLAPHRVRAAQTSTQIVFTIHQAHARPRVVPNIVELIIRRRGSPGGAPLSLSRERVALSMGVRLNVDDKVEPSGDDWSQGLATWLS